MNVGVVAGRLDGAQQCFGRDIPEDCGPLGGVVNARLDPLDLVESLFDTRRTRRARHPLNVELDRQTHDEPWTPTMS